MLRSLAGPSRVRVRAGLWGAVRVAVRPGACLGGKVALVGGLQTSAVGRPIEHVAAATQALEAARGVDADVVAGPLEGALVDVCVATGRESVGSSRWRGHRLPLRHLKSISAWTAPGPRAWRTARLLSVAAWCH